MMPMEAVPDTEAVKSLSEIIYKNPRTKPIWDSFYDFEQTRMWRFVK